MIKTQPDNVDQFLETTAFLLSACSADGGGAGHQCYSGRGEYFVYFFITKGTNSKDLGLRSLGNVGHQKSYPGHSFCFRLLTKCLGAFSGYILCCHKRYNGEDDRHGFFTYGACILNGHRRK